MLAQCVKGVIVRWPHLRRGILRADSRMDYRICSLSPVGGGGSKLNKCWASKYTLLQT